jgi:hypothetical protein
MITKVVGVTFSNEDGSSRARIIASMSESDQICLERDPYNQFDSNAVKVCVVKNGEKKQIGFLAKDLASEVSPKLRRGVNFRTTIVGCGIWNERPFCEIEVEEISSSQTATKTMGTSASAPRPVAPRPVAPKPIAPKTTTQPTIQNKVIHNPVSTPHSSNINSSSNSYSTPKSNNSGCLGIIVIAIVVSVLIII